jgi:hypothetical protein
MMREPEKIPAQPSPAIALPTINAGEEGAAPQTTDPSSKIADQLAAVYNAFVCVLIAPIYVHLTGKYVYIFPKNS